MILNIFWIFLIIFLSVFGIYVSKKIKFRNYNIFHIFHIFKSTNKIGLFMTLGTKIGVGSLIGIAAAICVGGAGSIFWMWIFSLLTSSLIYLEVKIGGKYKEKVESTYASGPYYIIKNGIKRKNFGILVGFLLIITYSFLFLMVQTNTISSIVLLNINVSKTFILIILLILLALTVFFNLKELLNITSYLVPIMCFIFIMIAITVIIKNIYILPSILKSMIFEAFNYKSFIVGLLIGVKRSVFLNEVLVGTTSSTALAKSENDECSALIAVLGSYFITFIVGSLNAIIVLIFLNYNLETTNYNELLNNVFIYHFGDIGSFILLIILLLFGLTTIISGIYIGISNLNKMINNRYIGYIFKFFVVLFCCMGLYINIDLLWKIIDIFLLMLLLINGIVLYKIVRGKYDWK